MARARSYLDGLNFDINADAPLANEAEPISAVLQYIHKEKIGAPAVVAQDENQVTMTRQVPR